jgi:hypothetical protein
MTAPSAAELKELAGQLQAIVARLQPPAEHGSAERSFVTRDSRFSEGLRRVGTSPGHASDGESTDTERSRYRPSLYPHVPKRRVALLDAERRLFFDLDALKLDDYS